MKEITEQIDNKSTGIEVGDYKMLNGVKHVVTGFMESEDGVLKLATFRAER